MQCASHFHINSNMELTDKEIALAKKLLKAHGTQEKLDKYFTDKVTATYRTRMMVEELVKRELPVHVGNVVQVTPNADVHRRWWMVITHVQVTLADHSWAINGVDCRKDGSPRDRHRFRDTSVKTRLASSADFADGNLLVVLNHLPESKDIECSHVTGHSQTLNC